MKHFLWLLAILIIAVPVAAQDRNPQDENYLSGRVDVTNITITRTNDNQLSLTIYGNPISCEAPIVEQSQHSYNVHDENGDANNTGNLIDVQITTAPMPLGTVCNFFAPFSHTVVLEGNFETDENYILTVNNFTAWIFLVRPNQVVMDMEIQQVDVGETELFGWLKSDLLIESADWGIAQDEYSAVINGSLPDGCAGEVRSYIAQDSLNPDVYHVELFRIVPLAVMCPAMLVFFEATVPTNIATDANVVFEVGDTFYTNQNTDDATLTAVMQRLLTINSVSITGSAGAYQVLVNGTQMGNCGAPLQEVVGENGAVSIIEIFDLVPELAPCTRNLILYENTFTVANMPIIVNGQIHFADNAGGNLPEEGNIMQVDTVIEDVQIEILESFPMQVVLTLTGYQPDGCDFPVQIDQSRTDDTVTLHIYREVPADVACTMNIPPYEDRIQLEGGFSGDSVTVIINGTTYTFDL